MQQEGEVGSKNWLTISSIQGIKEGEGNGFFGKYGEQNVDFAMLTIKEIAKIALRATGKDLEIKFDETKPDGQFRKDTSPNKLLKEIDFEFMTLEKGIKRVYDNFSKRHDR